MAGERRIIGKAMEKPVEVIGAENITIKPKIVLTTEQRLAQVEAYLISADPYIRSASEIQELKKQVGALNEEITKLAGVQARTNQYLDGKLMQIDQTFVGIVNIVKKLDEDFKLLTSDDDDDISVPASDNLFEDETPKETK